MLKPAYKVKIGSETYDSTNNAGALSINVDCDIQIPLDASRVVLRPGGDTAAIKAGDGLSIELGYEDSLKLAFTGRVDSVEYGITGVIVSGYSLAAPLTRLRLHQVYEKQTAGAIVKDLAGRANVALGAVEDGISFPMFVADESKTLYGHIRELAVLCGFDLFMTPEGELVFKPYRKKKGIPFTYGVDIVAASARVATPPATGAKVFGESPASFKGADTAHWLSKKVIEGASGTEDNFHIIAHPAIRDKDTADRVAAAALKSLIPPMVGTLKTMGAPDVGLGDTIEIKDMPDARMNDAFEVTKVGHAFNMDEGFVTTFGWIRTPAGP